MGLTKKKIYYWLKILKRTFLYIIKYFYNFLIKMENNFDMPRGNFVDTRNGQKIVVRDNVIDGDNMLLITSIGQISLDDFSKYYIQVSDDVYDINGRKIGTDSEGINNITSNLNEASFKRGPVDLKESNKHIFNPVDLDDGTNEDESTNFEDNISQLDNKESSLDKDETIKPTEPTKIVADISYIMVSKLFSNITKNNDLPFVKVDFNDWDNFPKNQLNMLIESFGVTYDDITNYIYSKYINTDDIKKSIKDFLSKNLVKEK